MMRAAGRRLNRLSLTRLGFPLIAGGVALLLLGFGKTPPPLVRRIVVQPGASCPVGLDMEIVVNGRPIPFASGLKAGDCVDVSLLRPVRVCCPTAPRQCGGFSATLAAAPTCKRMVTP